VPSSQIPDVQSACSTCVAREVNCVRSTCPGAVVAVTRCAVGASRAVFTNGTDLARVVSQIAVACAVVIGDAFHADEVETMAACAIRIIPAWAPCGCGSASGAVADTRCTVGVIATHVVGSIHSVRSTCPGAVIAATRCAVGASRAVLTNGTDLACVVSQITVACAVVIGDAFHTDAVGTVCGRAVFVGITRVAVVARVCGAAHIRVGQEWACFATSLLVTDDIARASVVTKTAGCRASVPRAPLINRTVDRAQERVACAGLGQRGAAGTIGAVELGDSTSAEVDTTTACHRARRGRPHVPLSDLAVLGGHGAQTGAAAAQSLSSSKEHVAGGLSSG